MMIRRDLEKVMSIMREDIALEKSVGTTLDNIAFWIYGLVDRISELDLSEEGITNLMASLAKEAEKATKFFPQVEQAEKPKKPRGRPPGSKNKKKKAEDSSGL